MFSSEYLFDDFINEEDIEYNKNTYVDANGEDIENDEEFDINSVPNDIKTKFGEWLLRKIDSYSLDIGDSEYPAWSFLSNPKLIKNQWLIHFTKDAKSIAEKGFIYGVDDIDKLGLTTRQSDFDKKYGGYNFAYLLSDFDRFGRSRRGWGNEKYKYGDEAVIFNASGVKLYHATDEEPQVIFYGNTAKNIIPIISGENLSFGIYSDKTGRLLFESDRLDTVVDWIVLNYDQYRKQL